MTAALVVVDMLNPYEHEDAGLLVEQVAGVVEPMAELIGCAQRDEVPLVYVNDNHGEWNSSQEELAEAAMSGARPDLVEPVRPPAGADFAIKARHTIFYMTPLEYLGQRGIVHLVLVGQVTEQCILYSALDAYERQLQVTRAVRLRRAHARRSRGGRAEDDGAQHGGCAAPAGRPSRLEGSGWRRWRSRRATTARTR
jgi:nicotinamidase-related amidase